MANIKATIFFDKRYWVGTFERTNKEGYAIARHIHKLPHKLVSAGVGSHGILARLYRSTYSS